MYKAGLHKFFKKFSIHLKNFGYQKGNAKQVPYRRSTNSKCATRCPEFEHHKYDVFSRSFKSNKHMDLNRLVTLYFESVVYVNGIQHK